MKKIEYINNDINMLFEVDDENKLLICDISCGDKCIELSNRFFNAIDIHTSGSNANDHHGAKHTGSMCPCALQYQSHSQTEDKLEFMLKNSCLQVTLIYQFYKSTNVVRSYSVIKNISNNDVGLEYVSSLCLYNLDINKIYIPHNSWCREINWRKYSPEGLGYSKVNSFSTKRIAVSNTGTWSTKEYLPMGYIDCGEKGFLWQIENNGSWNWEISDIGEKLYLKLSGPSEQENNWWKNLKPGESFESVKCALAVSSNGFDDAVYQMTKYRRQISSRVQTNLPVIFNDYMNCLDADPTYEKMLPQIDAAANAGAEIYCMDAGWYADGAWWDTVGEWKVCEKRFPGGMKKVFDYIKSKGMLSGIWLEPEVMGINCPIHDKFDDECFFMRHGKRVIDHGRYHLDMRNKKVIDYLNNVVDKLISEYEIGYFKFDYNIDGGIGTEVNSDSFGDGLMQYSDAYIAWINSIYERHPDIIIENCASGGMRMDYKSLSDFAIQSLTDATEYLSTAPIAAMSSTAVLPEQAAVWCLPLKANTNGEIAFNIVNAMFKRIHLSAETALLNSGQLALLKEGIDYYKSIRNQISHSIPIYPLDIVNFESDVICSGYRVDDKTYILLGNVSCDGEISIPIKNKIKSAKCVYPKNSNAEIALNNNVLKVSLSKQSAVIIELYVSTQN